MLHVQDDAELERQHALLQDKLQTVTSSTDWQTPTDTLSNNQLLDMPSAEPGRVGQPLDPKQQGFADQPEPGGANQAAEQQREQPPARVPEAQSLSSADQPPQLTSPSARARSASLWGFDLGDGGLGESRAHVLAAAPGQHSVQLSGDDTAMPDSIETDRAQPAAASSLADLVEQYAPIADVGAAGAMQEGNNASLTPAGKIQGFWTITVCSDQSLHAMSKRAFTYAYRMIW